MMLTVVFKFQPQQKVALVTSWPEQQRVSVAKREAESLTGWTQSGRQAFIRAVNIACWHGSDGLTVWQLIGSQCRGGWGNLLRIDGVGFSIDSILRDERTDEELGKAV